MKREYRQIEHVFMTDFTGSCPNDIGGEKKPRIFHEINDISPSVYF